jgi:hypothetical protein
MLKIDSILSSHTLKIIQNAETSARILLQNKRARIQNRIIIIGHDIVQF